MEVVPDKMVVWVLQDFADLGPATAVQILDDPGVPEIPWNRNTRVCSRAPLAAPRQPLLRSQPRTLLLLLLRSAHPRGKYRQPNRQHRSVAEFAGHLNLAAQHLAEPLTDRQSQSGAAVFAGG